MAAPIAPPPPAPAPNQPGVLSRLLRSISSVYTNPNDAALLGMASGFGAAGAPHMLTPISFGQAMSMASQGAQQYRQQSIANTIQQQAALPLQVAKTQQAVGALDNPVPMPTPAQIRQMARTPAGQKYLGHLATQLQILNNVFGGHNAAAGELDAALKGAVTPIGKAPGQTFHSSLGAATGAAPGMHGAPPEATQTTPGGGLAQIPGAGGVIAANAYNKAGGAATGAYPAQAALHYVTRTPGHPAGTLGAPPTGFVPVQPGGPNAAAQQAAMQRMIGLETGLTNAAQAAGRPGPFPQTQGAASAPPGVGPSGGFPQRTPQGVAPPGSLAAERAAGAQNLPSVAAQMKAAQAAGVPAPGAPRPILTLPGAGAQPAVPPQGGIFSNGESPAALAAQKAIGAQTAEQVKDATAGEDAARKQIALYNEMNVALSKMGPTGAWRDVTLPLGHLANYFGFTPGNITSAAEFDKYRVQLVGAATRGVSPRASTQEMGFLAKQVPNYNMPGVAPRILLSQLRGLSQYEIVKTNGLTTYLQTVAQRRGGAFRGTSMGFAKWWVNNGPSPTSIVMASTLAGLSPAERATYVGNLRKSLTGRHMIRQYQRAEAFEQRYPGVFKGL